MTEDMDLDTGTVTGLRALAAALGYSERAASAWVSAGMPCVRKPGPGVAGVFDVAACATWICRNRRSPSMSPGLVRPPLRIAESDDAEQWQDRDELVAESYRKSKKLISELLEDGAVRGAVREIVKQVDLAIEMYGSTKPGCTFDELLATLAACGDDDDGASIMGIGSRLSGSKAIRLVGTRVYLWGRLSADVAGAIASLINGGDLLAIPSPSGRYVEMCGHVLDLPETEPGSTPAIASWLPVGFTTNQAKDGLTGAVESIDSDIILRDVYATDRQNELIANASDMLRLGIATPAAATAWGTRLQRAGAAVIKSASRIKQVRKSPTRKGAKQRG